MRKKNLSLSLSTENLSNTLDTMPKPILKFFLQEVIVCQEEGGYMGKKLPIALILGFISFSKAGTFYDCVYDAIDMERAINVAREHVGKPFKAWVSQSKRTGECFWKVKGTEGYVIMEAGTGEVIKFYRNRK